MYTFGEMAGAFFSGVAVAFIYILAFEVRSYWREK